MPSGARTDKPTLSGDDVRLDLLQTVKAEVFGGEPRLQVSDFELNLPGLTETYDTFQALKTAYPRQQFWFVYGADSIATMDTWQHGAYLRRTLAMVALPRAGFALPAESERIRHLQLPDLTSISSTEVRQRITAGVPYDNLVSAAIARMISRDKLYA